MKGLSADAPSNSLSLLKISADYSNEGTESGKYVKKRTLDENAIRMKKKFVRFIPARVTRVIGSLAQVAR